VTGQDGTYLAELLLGKSYQVDGIDRPPRRDPLEAIRIVGLEAKGVPGCSHSNSQLVRALVYVLWCAA
jgi:GDP-D-mannose dehydratase